MRNEDTMNSNATLSEIVRLSIELNKIHDEDMLLEKILFEARKIMHADAGSIYIRNGASLVFSHVQNDTIQKTLPPGRHMPYTVFELPINKSSISGYVASTGEMVIIDDVYNIPGDHPYHFDTFFDQMANYKTKSMLAVPLKNNLGDIIGVLQLINAMNGNGAPKPFDSFDEPLILHFASIASMVLERAGMTRSMILRMIRMAELRDPKETGAHVNRVASFSVELYERWARQQGIQQDKIDYYKDLLRMGAMLHDVGKVAISDLILKKPSSFTQDEYSIMKTHTWLGAKLFMQKSSELDLISQEITLSHHENWDGSGYPGKINLETGAPLYEDPKKNVISGTDIPIWGRIVSIADVYDALSSRRVYKGAWDESSVLDEMRKETGRKFDPSLIAVFMNDLDNIRALRAKYPDSD